jgi:hypothetical protein
MRKYLLMILTGLSLSVLGQTVPPSWTQDAYRERDYPSNEWYTGFVRERLKAGEDAVKVLKALERDAQSQLAESIIVKIEGETRVVNMSIQVQNGAKNTEQINTHYQQAIKTASSATTVKSEVKSYHDPATGMLYAFAAVRRSDLAAFYQKQINLDLNKVEMALGMAEQLAAAGKKMSAFRKCDETKKTLEGVICFQDLLAAVNPNASDDDLQIERSNGLQQTLMQALIKLEQSTYVFVDCRYEYKSYKDDAFSSDPGIICDIIKQSLSENDCSIVDDDTEADYTLTLIAYTTQRSDGSGNYGFISYYANVKGTLYNHLTGKKTVDFAILNDPDAYSAGKSAQDAATKAFKLPELKEKILEKILPKIKN